MVQTLQAKNLNLRHIIDQFGIKLVRDKQFFPEWQVDLPDLTESETVLLDKVQEGYFNLIEHPPYLETTVQVTVVSPLLFAANFYLPPFHIRAEEPIEVSIEDEGVVIRGQLDPLLLHEQFWLMVIESKRMAFSLEAGLGQLLAYLFANPHPEKPSFGLITNGGSFMFLKLVQGIIPQYATSRIFELRNPGNELYEVFRILKKMGQLPLP